MSQFSTSTASGFRIVIKHYGFGNIKNNNDFLGETSWLGAFVARKNQLEWRQTGGRSGFFELAETRVVLLNHDLINKMIRHAH